MHASARRATTSTRLEIRVPNARLQAAWPVEPMALIASVVSHAMSLMQRKNLALAQSPVSSRMRLRISARRVLQAVKAAWI